MERRVRSGKYPETLLRHFKDALKSTTISDQQLPRSLASDKKALLLYITLLDASPLASKGTWGYLENSPKPSQYI